MFVNYYIRYCYQSLISEFFPDKLGKVPWSII